MREDTIKTEKKIHSFINLCLLVCYKRSNVFVIIELPCRALVCSFESSVVSSPDRLVLEQAHGVKKALVVRDKAMVSTSRNDNELATNCLNADPTILFILKQTKV